MWPRSSRCASARYLRDRLGKIVIVGGEAFPHMMPIKSEIRYFYQQGCFDYYIQGYGEAPLLDRIGRARRGCAARRRARPGLSEARRDDD